MQPIEFQLLYRNYRQKVFSDAFRMTGSLLYAEDIMQDVFVKCLKQPERLNTVASIDAYLFTLTRNCCVDFLRSRKAETINREHYDRYYKQLYPPTEDPVQEKEYRQLVDEAIGRLPLRRRQAFILNKEMDLQRKQVAQVTGISELSVKKHLQLAIRDIKKFVEERLGEAI